MVETEVKAAPAPAAPAPAPASSDEGERNLLSAIAYIIGIFAILLYLFKKEDKYVRFHSVQSLFLWVPVGIVAFALGVAAAIFSVVPPLACALGALSWVILVAAVIVALYAAYKAFNGERYELPVIGPMANKYV